MKTYVLILSRRFPKTHPKAGLRTEFVCKFFSGQPYDYSAVLKCLNECKGSCGRCLKTPKIHTIRGNYELWKKRIEEVQQGKAVLSVRYWSGKPYHKDENGVGQVEVCKLDKNSGIGIHKLNFQEDF